jgi:hypothetical protein
VGVHTFEDDAALLANARELGAAIHKAVAELTQPSR